MVSTSNLCCHHIIIKEGKPLMIHKTIACLFIATKIEKTTIPKSHDLQVGNEHLYFEARAMQRMELLMLNILKWRMQPITPFSLLHHILKKVENNDPPLKSSFYKYIEVFLRTS